MPRPRSHDDELRGTLVELASRAVSRGGSQGLSLRKLAAEGGTTTAAIYTLFGGREALLNAVVDEGFRRFGEHLDAVPRSDDPTADLLALGIAYRENALANPHFYRVVFGMVDPRAGDDGAGDPAVASPTFTVLRDAVARLPAAEGADEMAIRLWSLAHGLVSLELAGLLPGSAAEREQRYAATLRAARP